MIRTLGLAFLTALICCCPIVAQETAEATKPTTDQPAVCPVLMKPDAANASETYVQYSQIKANEGFAKDLKAYAMTKLNATMKQPGMLSCTLLADLKDKNSFTVVEVWDSFASLEKFRESDTYQQVHGPEQLKKMEGWVAEFETQEMDAAIHWHSGAIASDAKGTTEASKVSVKSPYLLKSCALSGRPLDVKGSRTMVEVEGREIGTCCGGCAKFLQKDPTKFLAKVDKAHADQQRPIYPMTTCLVSGEALPAEGVIEKMVGNRLFRTCCEGCAGAIEEDTAKYVAILDKAAKEQQSKEYALAECPSCGKSTTSENVTEEMMVGGRLVRFCCDAAKAEYEKDKIAVIAKIDEALTKQRDKK